MPVVSDSKRQQSTDNKIQASNRRSFLAELKHREVYQTAGAYAVIAWGVTEILDGVISRLGWPDWWATLIVILFVVGFPVAMFLAWVFDWTSEGIQKTEPWTAMGRVTIVAAIIFLIAGSGGLFWLINPSGIAHLEQVGITVLPCRYRGEAGQAFRAEGVAGVINDKLAHLEQLHVPSFSSILELSAQNVGTAEIGEKASLSWLVECRIKQDQHRWQMDVSLTNVQSNESELVTSLEVETVEWVSTLDAATTALVQSLGFSNTQNKTAGRSTGHVRSFDAYLKGEQAMRGKTAEYFQAARDYFHTAQQAPGFELARVREADAFMWLLETSVTGTDREKAAGFRAIGLMLDAVEAVTPELAELYVARMRFALLSGNHNDGESLDLEHFRKWFEHAIELKPSYAEPYRLMAEVLLNTGEDNEAEALLEHAYKLDLTR
jgi:TolB-like protein